MEGDKPGSKLHGLVCLHQWHLDIFSLNHLLCFTLPHSESLGSAASSSPAVNGKGKGKKRAAGGLQDFSVEYAKSARAVCRGCEQKIVKVSKQHLKT